PLLATLLGRQLGVTPTTQDQPETAVAFGLHHVPLGTSGDLTVPAFAPVRPPVTPPRPWPPRAVPPPRPQYAPPPGKQGKNSKPWLIALAVVVVVAVVVTVIVLTTGSSESAESTVDCTTTAQRDRAGFTPCLRGLAGTVPDRATCRSADSVAALVHAQAAVTCEFGKGNVVSYYQGVTVDEIEAGAKPQLGDGALERGTWDGGGLHGQYVAGVGSVTGIVLFGADDRRAAALYVSLDRQADLVAFFTQQLKPA
ncbi:MAG TPA: Hsp70 family protein, partial [Amycolatopsis sp.]